MSASPISWLIGFTKRQLRLFPNLFMPTVFVIVTCLNLIQISEISGIMKLIMLCKALWIQLLKIALELDEDCKKSRILYP